MEYGSDPRFEQVFTFDLPRSDLYQSILTFTVIELIAIRYPIFLRFLSCFLPSIL